MWLQEGGYSIVCDNTLLLKKEKEMIDVEETTNAKIFKTHLCIDGSDRNIRTYTKHEKN